MRILECLTVCCAPVCLSKKRCSCWCEWGCGRGGVFDKVCWSVCLYGQRQATRRELDVCCILLSRLQGLFEACAGIRCR